MKNRMAILERLRGRCKPLPPDLANDWHWFMKHWDGSRFRLLRAIQRAAWGSVFLDIVQDLLQQLRDDEDAFANWMRRERRQTLRAPALRL